MMELGWLALTALGVGLVAWNCYSMGYARGRIFEIEHHPEAQIVPDGLTKEDGRRILNALESMVKYMAALAPEKVSPTVHH